MIARRSIALLGLLLAAPGLLAAQAVDTTPRGGTEASPPASRPFGSGAVRMPKTLDEPLGLSLPDRSQVRRAEPAPVPNRSIEPPADRFANTLSPSLEPMLLPAEPRQGTTFGREHLRETGPDRPFDNFVPGARLRIPFEGDSRR